jgi:hypothetical protein
MTYIARRAVVGASVVAALLAFGAVANAQGPNKCLAGKNKCASKKMQGLLKCHAKAEKDGVPVDPLCTGKAIGKFDGGTVPTKGCFAKLEIKNDGPCLTNADTSAMENKVDAFVTDVVSELDPNPAPDQNDCSAGKKKCVLKKAAALLKCHEKAVKDGLPLDAACTQKAKDKFDGGTAPSKGCFEKLEAKGGCLTLDDTAALEAKVDSFVQDVLCELGYTTIGCVATPTPAPTATATPVPGFKGALGPPTTGLFNYAGVGIPGSDAACNTNFPGSHTCTYAELQTWDAANQLIGAVDTNSTPVTAFWAIDSAQPDIRQCHNPVAWGYQTAHTGHFGDKVPLTAGHLGALQPSQVCATTSWVGCCV